MIEIKQIISAVLITAATFSSAAIAQQQQITQYPGWELVWHDEFDQPGRLCDEKWGYERGFVRNRELQWYQPENAYCQDGMLIIEGRREKIPNPTYSPTSSHWGRSREYIEYTSASVTTRGKHSWKYGRFEVRAKIDARDGLWPAIWTLGIDRRWPQCGEIDIMEYYRGMILANVCWWDGQETWGTHWEDTKTPIEQLIEKTDNPDWADQFHIWTMDWDPDYIRLYVDDILLNEVDISKATYQDGFNPFHQPHYILLNLAIGGTEGGDPSQTEFPSLYKIDYVRVYQRK